MTEKVHIQYSETYTDPDYILLELTEDLLSELEKNGLFTIKGAATEEAVLCTENSCFAVREAPSSNSLFLFDSKPEMGVTQPKKMIVTSLLGSNLQLNRTRVNIEALIGVVGANPLTRKSIRDVGIDSLDNPVTTTKTKFYTFSDLEKQIQCSTEELKVALKNIEAFEYLGFWRRLDFECEVELAKHLVNTIMAQGWDINGLYKQDLERACANNFGSELIQHIVNIYTLPAEGDSLKLTLNVLKYMRIMAELIFKDQQVWIQKTFLISWQKTLPDFCQAEVSMLDGIACIDETNPKELKLVYLPASTLSHNPKIRLAELFKVKTKWTFTEIKPYLADLISPDMNEEQILVAFTRSSQGPNGIKLYSSR